EEGHGLAHRQDRQLPVQPVDQLDLLIRLPTGHANRAPGGAVLLFADRQRIVSIWGPPCAKMHDARPNHAILGGLNAVKGDLCSDSNAGLRPRRKNGA
ncbi:hypothetical protein, partial [Albidovulum sp.]|uniref:hypothetical protein n=1 Tax=Albidovulum sp. TaxID=1872424 RepID=UPI0039B846F9